VRGNGDVVEIWVLSGIDSGNRCQAHFSQCAKSVSYGSTNYSMNIIFYSFFPPNPALTPYSSTEYKQQYSSAILTVL